MKKIVLILSLLVLSILAVGQTYKGRVVDIKGNPVPFANVVLYSLLDSTYIKGISTNFDGKFEIKTKHKNKKHLLEVSHVSYLTKDIPLTTNHSLDITLYENMYSTKEIIVTGRKRILEFKDGNVVANVSVVPNAKSSTVAKVLKQLPGVTASEREGLTLNGISAVLYIDGRKQQLEGVSIIKMLEALPAASVEQIELKSIGDGTQSASDSGAIINLKTNKKKLDGYFLSIGAEGVLYDDNKINGGSNFFYMLKKDNILFNTSFSFKNDFNRVEICDSTLYRNGSKISNSSKENESRSIYIASSNLGWEFIKGHNLNINAFMYTDYSITNTEELINSSVSSTDTRYLQTTKSKGNDDLWSGNIEYSSPDSLTSKIVASYAIDFGGLRNKKDYYKQFKTDNEKEWYLYSNPEMFGYRHTVRIDYTQKIIDNDLRISAGIKTDFGHLNDDVLNREKEIIGNYPDSYFSAKENVYAGYGKLFYNITPKLGVNASLRIEHTNYAIDLKSDNTAASSSYTNFFPYFHLFFRPSDNYQTILAYISGISRVNYNHLLPGIRYNNEYSYAVGNSNLKPIMYKSIAWVHYIYGYGNITLRYQMIQDLEGQVLTGKNDGVTKYTYLNYADYNRFKANAYLPFELLNKRLSGFFSGNITYNSLSKAKNGYIIPKGRGSFWKCEIKGSTMYKVTSKLAVNTWAKYVPSYSSTKYDYKSNWTMDIGFTYSMFKKDKITFALSAENIFDTNKENFTYYYGENILNRNKHFYDRFLKFSVFIKFNSGKEIRDKARENTNDISRFRD